MKTIKPIGTNIPCALVLGTATLVLGTATVLACWLAPAIAHARSSLVLPYPPSEVWPTSVRYLRVDRGAIVREKDAESGYVLFDLSEPPKLYKGSLELVRTTDSDNRESTRVVVNLPDLPRHHEITLLDKLTAKVKDEYGSPAAGPPRPLPPAPPPKKSPDAGVLPRPTQGELPRPERR